MNKVYTLAGLLLLASAAPALAQGTELFFSEYDEGAHPSVGPCPNTPGSTGNEKAMEIYNPTTSTVDLSYYSVRRYSNGTLNYDYDERVQRTTGPNTLAPSTPFVMANDQATLAEIRNVTDQYCSPRTSSNPTVLLGGGPIYFNGDDAMVLVRWTGTPGAPGSTGVLIDIFGIVGHQPPAPSGTGQWTGTDQNGAFVASANQSLRRQPQISSGNVTWNRNTNPALDPLQFNLGAEWETYSQAYPPAPAPADPCAQSYADLGVHNYTGPNGLYVPLSVLADFSNAISFYPNPAHGRVNLSLGTAKVGQITILNAVGKSILVRPGTSTDMTVDVSSLAPGLYFAKCSSADGKLTIYKELVVQ